MREQLLKTLRTDVVSHVVTNGWPLLGIAAHTDEIESETIAQVQRNINTYGLQIVRLGNFTITLKPEDEDKLKNFLKDVQYTKLAGGFQQYAAGAAMIGAGQGLAQGPGQGGGINPAFLGVGLGVGGLVAGQLGQTVAAGGQIQVRCPNCHALNAENAKFCNSCGQALSPAPAPTGATMACPKCGTQNAANAKFCTSCGQSLTGGGAPAQA
jgi:membrane protease subunit (stomatin/prohibitin family)